MNALRLYRYNHVTDGHQIVKVKAFLCPTKYRYVSQRELNRQGRWPQVVSTIAAEGLCRSKARNPGGAP
jgi:hypothetical protein